MKDQTENIFANSKERLRITRAKNGRIRSRGWREAQAAVQHAAVMQCCTRVVVEYGALCEPDPRCNVCNERCACTYVCTRVLSQPQVLTCCGKEGAARPLVAAPAIDKGGAGPRAHSDKTLSFVLSLPILGLWVPRTATDTAACARSFRMPPSAWICVDPSRSKMAGIAVQRFLKARRKRLAQNHHR